MKKLFLFLFLLIQFIIGCEVSNESIVGREDDVEIRNITFIINSTYIDHSASKLVAEGTVKNTGRSEINSPWYVEAQFYTDSTFSTKLGGNSTRINVPLSNGQQTFWTIKFSSSQVNILNYPNFAVSDLRAIYK